ncbi:MAG: energy coupling factor transporter S component ThiW [Ruminococcus sp.]|nr:energy coupling factor transporter S component ThiW [Ruminococcus sp.]
MKKRSNIIRLILMAMMIALGVVISPILRVEGMCPMAHFINVTCAVLLGPWEALICAVIIGLIRMLAMGIPPLALTGAIFGAFFSGLLYRLSKGKLLAAMLGEIFGTGIVGAVISYPVMKFIWGRDGLTWFFYVPSFIAGTLIGGSIAFAFLRKIAQNGQLERFQSQLGSEVYAGKSTLIGNGIAIASVGVIGYVVINIVCGMFRLESVIITYISRGILLAFILIALIYVGVKKFGKTDFPD